MCIEPRPLEGYGGDDPPGNLHALRLLLGLQNGWKLAVNELLSIKKMSTSKLWGGGEISVRPPVYMCI